MSFTPDRLLNALLVSDRVYLFLFNVVELGASTVATKCLIVSDVGGVAFLEGTEEWRLLQWKLFVDECLASSISHEMGVKSTVLTNYLTVWLISVENLAVLLCVFMSFHILFALVRIFFVADAV
jgi:hypothetical protein